MQGFLGRVVAALLVLVLVLVLVLALAGLAELAAWIYRPWLG